MNNSLFHALPLWALFILTVFMGLLAVEIGFRVGVVAARRSEHEREAPMDAMVGSTLGLLAFVLAFTFGMASSRYDAASNLVLEDAIAIRTADLRAQLLAQPYRSEARALLREYVDVRVKAVLQPGELQPALVRTEELQDQLWSRAVELGQEVPAAYVQALIQMRDLHSKRVTALRSNRIPGTIWIALYSLMGLAMGVSGYRSGIGGRRSVVTAVIVVMAFSAVIGLISDLDRPQEGFFKVSQQPLLELQAKVHR